MKMANENRFQFYKTEITRHKQQNSKQNCEFVPKTI